MPKAQKQVAVAQREEDDSVVAPFSSPKRSLQMKKDSTAKRPKPTPSVPSRVQPRRSSSSQDQSNAQCSSSSILLKQLDEDSSENGSSAAYADMSSQRQSSRTRSKSFTQDSTTTKTRPTARPRCRPKVTNGKAHDAPHQEPESGAENQDVEGDSSSSSEEDNENDCDYAEPGQKVKKKNGKKNDRKKDDEEQIVGLTLPERFEISKNVERLQEWNELFSQHKNMQDDSLDDLQDESFELPETSQGLKNCPLCRAPLPDRPSKKLRKLLDYWLREIKTSGSTPSSIATAGCCQLHEAEKVHIPLGKENKWPHSHKNNEAWILKKLWRNNDIRDRLMDLVIHPEQSDFYCRQVERREKHGRQAGSVQSQMQYFHEEQAGYFGELGGEVIRRSIYHLCEKGWGAEYTLQDFTNRPNNWMKESDFVDKVLFPEAVCGLIQKHEKERRGNIISINEAERIRDESNAYGSIMFPIENGEEDHDDDSTEKSSPISIKRASGGRRAASTSRSRGKVDNSTCTNGEGSRDVAIEISSGQRTAPNRSTRQKAACNRSSSQQLQSPTASPSRPRPRPSQSRLSQQMPKVDMFGETMYNSQDQIKSWAVTQIASSPDLQASGSSTIHVNSRLGSSQIASDGSSPLTEMEISQKDSSDI